MGRNALLDRATVLGCLEAIEAACTDLERCSLDGFTSEELVSVLQRREAVAWRAPVIDHRILARLVADGNPGELGATTVAGVLEQRLRISLGAARQRVKEAADLGPRVAVSGAPLEPVLPNLAAAQAAGRIGPEHVEIARKAYAKIPAAVDAAARERAERDLALLGGQFGPQAFQKLADHMVAVLDPDGDFADRDRQARRGLRMSRQSADGMSTLHATITPELRATLEPLFAKLAAPGMCNPADEHPCVSGTPTEAQILNDDRTVAQRHHDALQALGRAVLASGDLGQLNGLPVTVIVTTTLAELHAAAGLPEPETADTTDTPGPIATDATTSDTAEPEAAAETETPPETAPEPQPAVAPAPDAKPLTGKAITAGGTLLPMSDLIRMASHAYHYLSIFDGQGRPLWLGRTKRLASADQRIVLHARDRGCTRPGCTIGGYHTQVHHLTDWAHGGTTDINSLGLACPGDNRMATEQNWNTQLGDHGRVQWTPPPPLQHQQPPTNPYHFIEDLIDYYRAPVGTDPPDKPDDTPGLSPEDRPPDDDLYPWFEPPLPGEPGYDEAVAEFAADSSWYLFDEGAEAQF